MKRKLAQLYHGSRHQLDQFRVESRYRVNRLADRLVGGRFTRSNSVIANSFWRSGSTWLQDLLAGSLGAKSIFEPFAPPAPGGSTFISRYVNARDEFAGHPKLVPVMMPTACEEGWEYLDAVLSGKFSNHGKLRNRKSMREGLRRGVCAKFVRGHFMLGAIQRRYGLPVIHLTRDPYSVVASVTRVPGWNQGGFEQLDLGRLLLGESDGKAEICGEFEAPIRKFDSGDDAIQKLAAYWCATELVARREIDSIDPGDGLVLSYENLIAGGVDCVDETLAQLGLTARVNLDERDFQRRSMSTHKAAGKHTQAEREIREMRDRVGEVLETFGMVR